MVEFIFTLIIITLIITNNLSCGKVDLKSNEGIAIPSSPGALAQSFGDDPGDRVPSQKVVEKAPLIGRSRAGIGEGGRLISP